MTDQIFLSPQVERSVIVELTDYICHYDLMKQSTSFMGQSSVHVLIWLSSQFLLTISILIHLMQIMFERKGSKQITCWKYKKVQIGKLVWNMP